MNKQFWPTKQVPAVEPACEHKRGQVFCLHTISCLDCSHKGYLVCTAKYDNATEAEEEYIDLIPILRKLYFDPEAFLTPIQEVRVHYDCIHRKSGQKR